ncbi:MAG: hypothetical protein GWP10_14440 [Nitrospiraceae bacterium]|nr:hypothetical protein [Nitrospiraceae bacterium]
MGTATALLLFSLLIPSALTCFNPFLNPWGDFTLFASLDASNTPSFLTLSGVKFFRLPRYPLPSLTLVTAQLPQDKKGKAQGRRWQERQYGKTDFKIWCFMFSFNLQPSDLISNRVK